MMPIRLHPFKLSRRGIALPLVMALGLSIFIITLTYGYGSMKTGMKPGFLTCLKADYQMESALLLHFHRLRTSEERFNESIKQPLPKQEIAPGLSLRVSVQKDSPQSYLMTVRMEGQGTTKSLSAKAVQVASSSQALTGSDSQDLSTPQWKLEFLPQTEGQM